MSNVHKLRATETPPDDSEANGDLPREGTPSFRQSDERIKRELVEKFAWSAQHGGIVYRGDPVTIPPLRDYAFNRISRAHHSFRFRDERGKTRTRFYRMEDLLAGLDDPEMDFGFICAE